MTMPAPPQVVWEGQVASQSKARAGNRYDVTLWAGGAGACTCTGYAIQSRKTQLNTLYTCTHIKLAFTTWRRLDASAAQAWMQAGDRARLKFSGKRVQEALDARTAQESESKALRAAKAADLGAVNPARTDIVRVRTSTATLRVGSTGPAFLPPQGVSVIKDERTMGTVFAAPSVPVIPKGSKSLAYGYTYRSDEGAQYRVALYNGGTASCPCADWTTQSRTHELGDLYQCAHITTAYEAWLREEGLIAERWVRGFIKAATERRAAARTAAAPAPTPTPQAPPVDAPAPPAPRPAPRPRGRGLKRPLI